MAILYKKKLYNVERGCIKEYSERKSVKTVNEIFMINKSLDMGIRNFDLLMNFVFSLQLTQCLYDFLFWAKKCFREGLEVELVSFLFYFFKKFCFKLIQYRGKNLKNYFYLREYLDTKKSTIACPSLHLHPKGSTKCPMRVRSMSNSIWKSELRS